jgi:predicted PurR-regulated permease PerM
MTVETAARRPSVTPLPGYQSVVVGAILVAALFYGREVLMPFALALLLSFLVAPLVRRLQRWNIPRLPAVFAVVVLSFLLIGVIGWFVTTQLVDLAGRLPQYQENIHSKLLALHAPGGGLLDKTSIMVRQLSQDVNGSTPSTSLAKTGSGPVPVVVQAPERTAFDMLRDLAGSVIGPLGTAAVVIILVIFMLIQFEDLRDRFIGLIGTGRLHATMTALDDAGGRIGRYLSMQILVNVSYGIPIAIGLHFIGLPNPLLWGVLAGILRFVPYIGPAIGAAMPALIAFAVDPGWSMVLMTLALFLTLELLIANVLEPWLYGHSAGLSALTIVGAALFWTLIWGPIGLLLSTPLTVCLVVLGRHVPEAEFLSVVLGNEQALPSEARFYQRMLAMDQDEAEEVAQEFLTTGSLADLYDRLLVPALSLAEGDRNRGALDDAQKRFFIENTRALVERLPHVAPAEEAGAEVTAGIVAIVPAHDESDELAGAMLAQLLAQAGATGLVLPSNALIDDQLGTVAALNAPVVCISAVPPSALMHAAYACKRIRTKCPDVRIVVGLWSLGADVARLRARLPDDLATDLIISLKEGTARLTALAAARTNGTTVPPPVPANEAERQAALDRLHLLDTPVEEAVDRVTREVARIFDAPISLVSLIDRDRQFWKSEVGLPDNLARARQASRAESVCGHLVAQNDMLVVPDVLQDPRFAGNKFLQDLHVRFYAGAPLRTGKQLPIGSLCVIDTKPRDLSARERALLQLIADGLMQELELRNRAQELRDMTRRLEHDNRDLVEADASHQVPTSAS